MRWMFALLMLVLLQGVATAQPAGSPEEVELSLEDRRHASALSSSTLSPFCPGRTLSSCPSGKATEWRRDIRTWVAEGLDDKEILARLQARAPGFQLEGTPPTDWSWAGPLAVMALLTLAFVIGGRRAMRSQVTQSIPAAATPDGSSASVGHEPSRRLLEEELRHLD